MVGYSTTLVVAIAGLVTSASGDAPNETNLTVYRLTPIDVEGLENVDVSH